MLVSDLSVDAAEGSEDRISDLISLKYNKVHVYT